MTSLPFLRCLALLFLAVPSPLGADSASPAPAASPSPSQNHPVVDPRRLAVPKKADPSLPSLFLVGDSTMKVETPGQRGWGEEMAQFFDLTKINVVNTAIGGRSSRTFQAEGRWDTVLAMIQKSDFVIVQFGHNDASPINDNSRARGTIRGVGEETQEIDNMLTKKHEVIHSFGWYMRKYVTDIKAKGAMPIIMSLTPRNNWMNGKIVRATGENYGGWAQQTAVATGATFVDHNEIIAEALDKLGQDAATPMFADLKLHASPAGAKLNAQMAVSGLKGIPGDPLGPYFSHEADSIPAFTGTAAAK